MLLIINILPHKINTDISLVGEEEEEKIISKKGMIFMKKITTHSLLLLNTITVLALFGCGNNSDEKLSNKNNKNIEVIETVLEKTLNAPDKVLLSKLYDFDNATIIDQDSEEISTAVKDEGNDFDDYIEDKYGEYFTDYGFEKFFITSGEGYRYSDEADKANYILTTDKINIVQDDKNVDRFEFDVTVNYTNESNREGSSIVNGRVEMDNGKINSLNINNDEGLLEEMMSNQSSENMNE
ncbi:hypothetical protein [Carnobacterium sp. TMP28]|uniref:hypothetical protein n=1 Tax=Carnobacterium sp. TMP28 TaxID=3397060 RepID=UPI0039E1EAF8